MNKFFVFVIVSALFSLGFSELYYPGVWHSFRREPLVFSAGISEYTGETIQYELVQINEHGKESVLFTRAVKPAQDEKEWTLEFSGLRREVVGKDALWIRETIGNATPKIFGPYGFIRTKLIETEGTASSFEGDVRNFALSVGETHKFAHNRNGLIIALGNSDTDITISLDMANSKTAFLTFSNRIIIFRAEDKSISFFYPERSVNRDRAVEYRLRDWEGEMRVFDTANGKVIFIPWFDLGMQYEIGRRFGFAIHGNNLTYPVNASRHSPASWGNIILK